MILMLKRLALLWSLAGGAFAYFSLFVGVSIEQMKSNPGGMLCLALPVIASVIIVFEEVFPIGRKS